MRRKSTTDVANLVNQLNSLDSTESRLFIAEIQNRSAEACLIYCGDAMHTAALLELRISGTYSRQLETLMTRSEPRLFTFYVDGASTAGFVVETTTAEVLFVCTFSAGQVVPAGAV